MGLDVLDDLVEDVVEELVGVLVLLAVEHVVLAPQDLEELVGLDDARLGAVGHDALEDVLEGGKERLLHAVGGLVALVQVQHGAGLQGLLLLVVGRILVLGVLGQLHQGGGGNGAALLGLVLGGALGGRLCPCGSGGGNGGSRDCRQGLGGDAHQLCGFVGRREGLVGRLAAGWEVDYMFPKRFRIVETLKDRIAIAVVEVEGKDQPTWGEGGRVRDELRWVGTRYYQTICRRERQSQSAKSESNPARNLPGVRSVRQQHSPCQRSGRCRPSAGGCRSAATAGRAAANRPCVSWAILRCAGLHSATGSVRDGMAGRHGTGADRAISYPWYLERVEHLQPLHVNPLVTLRARR